MTTLKGFVQLLKISTSDEKRRNTLLSSMTKFLEMESILGEMLVLSKPSIE